MPTPMATIDRASSRLAQLQASRPRAKMTPGQSSSVNSGAGVSSQPKFPIIWTTNLGEWLNDQSATALAVMLDAIPELSGCVMFQASLNRKAMPAMPVQSQKTRRRTVWTRVPRSAISSPTTIAARTQASPSGRMQNRVQEAMPARARLRFSRLGSGCMKTVSTEIQARMPAAHSTALGLTTPPRNSTIGVAAAVTPSAATPGRRHSPAVATALASRAAQISAESSRIR